MSDNVTTLPVVRIERCEDDPMSELSDFFNSPRIRIAAFLLARDEACVSKPVPEELIQWATALVKTGAQQKHSGDCTKESHSCIRCTADRATRDADAILALFPNGECPEATK